MECDLFEVSGQMALPLPTYTSVRLLLPDVPSQAVHAPFDLDPRVVLSRSPLDFQRRPPLVCHGARMAHLRGLDQAARRGTATRAEGVTPDDRSLETAVHSVGALFCGRRARRDCD